MTEQRLIRCRALFCDPKSRASWAFWVECIIGHEPDMPLHGCEQLSPWVQFLGYGYGMEIWEGDLISTSKDHHLAVVVFEHGAWECKRRSATDKQDYYFPIAEYLVNEPARKVIGNIHENPELIPA